MVNIRSIKRGDFEAIYGHSPTRTVKGYCAELDGRPIAICGIYYMPDHIVAFVKTTEAVKHYRRAMASGYRKFASLLNSMDVPVFAVADKNLPEAENFLMRCGFKYLNKGPNGEVFVWHKHS